MGKRTTGRKLAMQTLYQLDIQKVEIEELIESYVLAHELPDVTRDWCLYLIRGVETNLEAVDTYITKYAIDWDINRFNLVDKNILRIAFFELVFGDTPHNVVIDEAIELSKRFSTEDSPKFINGILGAYILKECLPA